jgi:hypothetical protein
LAALREDKVASESWGLEDMAVIGLGHSMGGSVIIVQQGKHGTYDAIATMGTSNLGVKKKHPTDPGPQDPRAVTLAEARAAAIERQKIHFPDSWDEGYLRTRSPNSARPTHSHHDDVPAEVINALEWTPVPRMASVDAVSSKVCLPFAEQIVQPVLISFGDRDISRNPHEEVSVYRSSADVMLFVVSGSAHMHNTSSSRHVLWDRFAAWVRLLGASHA